MGVVDMLMLVMLLAAAGAFAGVMAGLLGAGGGIVIVPALFYVFTALDTPPETRMHVALGTSLATIIITSLRAAQSHDARGSLDRHVLRQWGPWIAGGAALGALLAGVVPTRGLMMVFGLIAFVVALYMGFAPRGWRLGEALPTGARRAGIGGTAGVISAMMGIGGGTFGVNLMTLYGHPIHRAVGTAAGFGAVIAIPGALVFLVTGWSLPRPPFSVGYVNPVGLAILVPMTVLCAPWGAALAHRLKPQTLRLAFALFLAVTALTMLREALYA